MSANPPNIVPWDALQYVTSGLTLVAFIVAIVAWVVKWRSEQKERLIDKAPDRDRAELVMATMEYMRIEPAGLTKQQRYDLALAQIHEKARRFRISALTILGVAIVLALLTGFVSMKTDSGTIEKTNSKLPEQVKDSDDDRPIVLSQPTEWDYGGQRLIVRGKVITQGHPFTIRATEVVGENALIVPFADSVPGQSTDSGSDGDRGRNGTDPGQDGQAGMEGGRGADGAIGTRIGDLVIHAKSMSGIWNLSTSGADGPAGGNGGNGGAGGAGAEGESSRSGFVDCSSGPGRGGGGGAGGGAGAGGAGGDGRSAGNISLNVSETFMGTIILAAKAGRGGKGGLPGKPGQGGSGGAEGSAVGNCRAAGRIGKSGAGGQVALKGHEGIVGKDGLITIQLPNEQRRVTGTYRYEQH